MTDDPIDETWYESDHVPVSDELKSGIWLGWTIPLGVVLWVVIAIIWMVV